MISEKETTAISKFLSLVLRHNPKLIVIQLDAAGWVRVDELLEKMAAHGKPLTRAVLDHVVATNTKKRFAFDEHGEKVRASQGHSVEVELGLQPQTPPATLYHGTGSQSVESILATGLEKRNRQRVHLSADTETATKVGQRHGKPVIFEVAALDMYAQGHKFYLSENGVWLTDVVPPVFLKLMLNGK
ncbi:RNA 2'-phosphotransferase [Mucilaginibacter terrenus]|uniref:Probable RNA 2'-phosphotransferase n=1 Tax=Mucilaginibacter terrenus TaxID=2482727 RepID=A0A3E2NY15_9SPHI|nr:RNA 2'-phosphotransferase [Mucilaginibacter terrenus]RFZ85750.1 RNA 2'-phosphotransferase [Mucilaginibacter terrenus]